MNPAAVDGGGSREEEESTMAVACPGGWAREAIPCAMAKRTLREIASSAIASSQ